MFLMLRIIPLMLLFSLYAPGLAADVILRLEIQQGDAPEPDDLDLRLFESVAPLTVENFMHYVNDTTVGGGDYINSFFHRSVPDFVIQGGGFLYDGNGPFSYDSVNDEFNGGLQEIVTDDPVDNEFKKSNLRGTIAMAKVGGDPNSATSQWFINLADNSANLDNQNGGFTVFGEVIGDGMTLVDNMVATHTPVDKTDVHPAFGALPLVDYTAGAPVDDSSLIKIVSTTELVNITGDKDFCTNVINTSVKHEVTVKNTGPDAINLGTIDPNELTLPFRLESDNCSSAPNLDPGEQCDFTIDFTPQTEETFSDSINIDLSSVSMNPAMTYTLSVAGSGALVAEPDISPVETALDYGEVKFETDPFVAPKQRIIHIDNMGNLELNINSAVLSGPDASEFTLFDNCVLVSPLAPISGSCSAPNSSCLMPVNLTPSSTGVKNAEVVITSDDPDKGTLVIPITAVVSDDTDGVLTSIEDGVNHTRDGNGDFVPDSIQSNVASVKASSGQYMTVVSRNSVDFRSVQILDNNQLVAVPVGVNFSLGAFKFIIDDKFSLGAVNVGFLLPPSIVTSSFYMYGPTSENTNPHWYEYEFDGETGADYVGNVEIGLDDGTSAHYFLVMVRVVDGGRGDGDMLENGIITFEGAVDVAQSDSEGSLDIIYLLSIILLLSTARKLTIARKTR